MSPEGGIAIAFCVDPRMPPSGRLVRRRLRCGVDELWEEPTMKLVDNGCEQSRDMGLVAVHHAKTMRVEVGTDG